MNGIKFLLPLAIAFAALPEGRIAAGGIRHTATGPTSTVVSGGVRIVTSMARAAYPSRALVEVRIRVKNVSSNNIEMSRSACGNAIQAQVLDRKGQVLYPPALPFFPPSCGPHVPPTTLPPGGHLGARAIVILRGRSVRAVVDTTIQVCVLRELQLQRRLHGGIGLVSRSVEFQQPVHANDTPAWHPVRPRRAVAHCGRVARLSGRAPRPLADEHLGGPWEPAERPTLQPSCDGIIKYPAARMRMTNVNIGACIFRLSTVLCKV